MRQILSIFILLLIYALVQLWPDPAPEREMSTLLVGVMLVSAFLFADLIKKMKLPMLTGYMLVGAALGPSGFKYLTGSVIDNLSFLENLALAFIALTAGGEIRFKQVAKYAKSISYILVFQLLIIFFGMIALFMIIAPYVPTVQNYSGSIHIGLAILFAGTALSTSPATTIGIITELESRGKITDLLLSVTVLKALVLILIFPVVIALSRSLLIEGSTISIALIADVSLQLISSVLIGIIIGILIIWYLSRINVQISLFLLVIVLVISEVSSRFGLEVLLTSIITGVVVQNFSKQGKSLISGIEKFALPIYVIFFCFAGARLHLETIGNALVLTLFLVFARFGLNYLGNYAGAALAGESNMVKHVSWLGYIAQAGIALGLGVIIEQNLSGELGKFLLTILASTVVINEIIGPILLKYVFVKAREVGNIYYEK
jgi:Kef-type K+ transport system membrane component KefB